MVYASFNHIQGKNGSRWINFIRNSGMENIILAIDAAKYTHKAIFCTFYGGILVVLLSLVHPLQTLRKLMVSSRKKKYKHGMEEIVVGFEATGDYALLNWSKTDNLDSMAIDQSMILGGVLRINYGWSEQATNTDTFTSRDGQGTDSRTK